VLSDRLTPAIVQAFSSAVSRPILRRYTRFLGLVAYRSPDFHTNRITVWCRYTYFFSLLILIRFYLFRVQGNGRLDRFHVYEFEYLIRCPFTCNVLVIEVKHYVKYHYVIPISS
jgi:hypothetical protein